MAKAQAKPDGLNRRTLLIGGGAAVGLVLGWELWPRRYGANLTAAPGETVLNAFLKIDTAGRVTVAVPQIEMGQGVWTALPQILADELGADWRQIAVEPAPLNPLYANRLLAGEMREADAPAFARGLEGWAAREWATRHELMITAGSTSIRAFETPFREAGAFARALLCMAAGKRLGADWQACDTEAGFVVRGNDRFRFGALAAEAAHFTPPFRPPLRKPGEGGLSGKSVPRLDLAAKVDGSVRYAGDVRFPGMLFGAIRHGPWGDTRLANADAKAASTVAGVASVVRADRWVAVLANNGWAAERGLAAIHPRFATRGAFPDSASVSTALDAAFAGKPRRFHTLGDADGALGGPGIVSATYDVPFAPHATLEPLVATARPIAGRLEVWAATQAPGLTRAAIAVATGLRESAITVFPMQIGGGFGRKLDNDAACEAAILALRAKRPVQLTWSRSEDMLHGRHRAPARAHMAARLGPRGRIAAWRATIAAPSSLGALAHRLGLPGKDTGAEAAAIDGALPPYALPALAIEHARADIGIETGIGRAGAHAYTAFFTECFVDELAVAAGQDALAFRLAMLGPNPRLARCLGQAAASGGWSGEAHAGQGLAAHSAFGSHVALYAEAALEGGAVTVGRLVAVVDCGRMINPDIVRQQIESGLVWGMAAALGGAVTYTRGTADQLTLDALALPRLADMPEIDIRIIASNEPPGGVAELAVPVVAPAIANALFSATGKRVRTLPLSIA